VEFGDGWHPMLRASELKVRVEELRTAMRRAGKADPEIIVRRGLKLDDLSAARAKIEAEGEAGATYYILDLGRYADEREFGISAEKFMAQVAL